MAASAAFHSVQFSSPLGAPSPLWPAPPAQPRFSITPLSRAIDDGREPRGAGRGETRRGRRRTPIPRRASAAGTTRMPLMPRATPTRAVAGVELVPLASRCSFQGRGAEPLANPLVAKLGRRVGLRLGCAWAVLWVAWRPPTAPHHTAPPRTRSDWWPNAQAARDVCLLQGRVSRGP